MASPTRPTETLGLILCRVVVPLWILLGASIKLVSGSPLHLPTNFVQFGRDVGIDLGHMLYTLIGLEFFAIAVMVLLSRFARPMALFMLSVFCLVLVGEMISGASSCGCFGGGVSVQPWQMLIVDGLLLIAVLAFPPRVSEKAMGFPKAAPIAAVLAAAGIGVSYAAASILHQDIQQEAEPTDDDSETDDPTVNPQPAALPSFWYAEDLQAAVGQPWREFDLFTFMKRWPAEMDEGTRYVVFYSRSCDHCQEMFEKHLSQPLDAPVIAIQIPYNTEQLTGSDPLFNPRDFDSSIEHAALPVGPNWVITAPMALRIEDGVITCAQEGDHTNCLKVE